MDLVTVASEDAKNIIFESVSIYFINAFWNKIYGLSKQQFIDKKYDTLLDAYKNNIERYSRSFSRQEAVTEKINEYYIDVLCHLTEYFCQQMAELGKKKIIHISDKDFAEIFSRQIIPREEFAEMGKFNERKSVVTRQVLTKTVSTFGIYMLTEMASVAVIDANRVNEKEKNIVSQLNKKFKEILEKERNDMYNMIIAARSNIDISQTQIDGLSRVLEERYTTEIRKLIDENNELIQINNNNVTLNKEYKKIIKSLQARVKELEDGLTKAITISATSSARRAAKAPQPVVKHVEMGKVTKSRSRSASEEDTELAEIAGNTGNPGERYVKNPELQHSKYTDMIEKLSYSGDDMVKDSSDELESMSQPESDE